MKFETARTRLSYTLLAMLLAAAVSLSPTFVSAAVVNEKSKEDEYLASIAATTRPRMALIIGNSAYPADPLPNASRDALTMDDRLRSMGFSVERHLNLSEVEFKTVLRQFWARANRLGGDAVFFFAGHGVGLGGRNLLLPIDTDVKSIEGIQLRGIDLMDALGAHASVHPSLNRLVILDSCRNDPARRGLLDGQATGFFVTDAPSSLISFSTSLGKLALDGPDGGNSFFTKNLARALLVEEIEASVLFTKVRDLVLNETGGKQVPVEFNTLRVPFVFRTQHAEALNDEESQIAAEVRLRLSKGLAAVPEDKIGKATEALYRSISLSIENEEKERQLAESKRIAEQKKRDARFVLERQRQLEAAQAEEARLVREAETKRLAAAKVEAERITAAEVERQRLAALEAERVEAKRVAFEAEAARIAAAERAQAEKRKAAEEEKLAQARRDAAERERVEKEVAARAAAARVEQEAKEAALAERARLSRLADDERLAAERAATERIRVAELERQLAAKQEEARQRELQAEREIQAARLAMEKQATNEARRLAEEERLATAEKVAAQAAEQKREEERRAAAARALQQRELEAEEARLAAIKAEEARIQKAAEERTRVALAETARLEAARVEREREAVRIAETERVQSELRRREEEQRLAVAAKEAEERRMVEEAAIKRALAVEKALAAEALLAKQRDEVLRVAEQERVRLEREATEIEQARLALNRANGAGSADIQASADAMAADKEATAELARIESQELLVMANRKIATESVLATQLALRQAIQSQQALKALRAPRRGPDGSVLVRGVRLPSDLRVSVPNSDVPQACASFVGGWTGGRWADVRTVEIWVESVGPDCTIHVVYAVGGTSVTGSAPSFQRLRSRVEGGKASLRLASGSTVLLATTRNRSIVAELRDVSQGKFEVELDQFAHQNVYADDGNYAFEQRRNGIDGTVAIRATNMWKPIPDNAPGVATIGTLALEELLRQTPGAVLIDALGEHAHKSLPGALLMPDFGRVRFPRAERIFAEEALEKAARGQKDHPIIVFERNTRYGWLGYHAVLRLVGLGYTNVKWYRGGLDAWHDAGLPLN